jgi:hypothetical protein
LVSLYVFFSFQDFNAGAAATAARAQLAASWKRAAAGFLLGLLFDHKNGGSMFLRNVGISPIYTVTNQKTVLFSLILFIPITIAPRVKWVPCHLGTARTQVAEVGTVLLIWSIGANI